MSDQSNLYPFCFDSSSSDKKCAEAIEGLHRLVELGKKAAAALRAIEKDGFCDSEVPYVESFHDAAVTGGRGRYARVEYTRLPKRLPVGREDLPRMTEVSVRLGDVREANVKGVTYKQAAFFVTIRGIEQVDRHGTYKPFEAEVKVGEIRFNRNSLRYVDPNEEMYRLYRVPFAGPGGMEAAERVATLLADMYVRVPDKQRPSQKSVDLRRACRRWLLDEKVPQGILHEVWAINTVKEVLEA